MMRSILTLTLCLGLVACTSESGSTDVGIVRVDAGVAPDAAPNPDASNPDALTVDTGEQPDAGFPDALPVDTGVADTGPADSGVEPECFTNPTTHHELINQCTTAQPVLKTPVLPLLNPDGTLPALP